MRTIRNMVSTLTTEELNVLLKAVNGRHSDFEGKTLGQFIDDKDMSSKTLTALMNEVIEQNLVWPFRYVTVTTKVTVTKEFKIAALDNADMGLDPSDFDPEFNILEAYEETAADLANSGPVDCDYKIVSDDDRVLVHFS